MGAWGLSACGYSAGSSCSTVGGGWCPEGEGARDSGKVGGGFMISGTSVLLSVGLLASSVLGCRITVAGCIGIKFKMLTV